MEPPRKKRRRCSEEEEKNTEKEEETYFYSLHLNKDWIIFSTNPDIKCNTNFDMEHDENNSKPNLFIVKKADDSSSYNSSSWLNYHLNERNDIKRAATLLNDQSLSLLVITGAGMGCDSNLPDYRSKGGFWNDYKGFKNKGLSLYDMSKTDWFISDPLQAFGFYTHRAKLYKNAKPHSGFNVLLNATNNNKRDYMYMTSNIDGQVIKSGFNQNNIYQTHGSLHHIQCIKNCENSIIEPFYEEYENININSETLKVNNLSDIPKCKYCKGLCRPNVSFFTDTQYTFNNQRIVKQKIKFMKWLNKFINTDKKLLVVEIGCGKSIHSLRWESEYLKTLKNITLIRINPIENIDKSNQSDNDRHIMLKLPAKLALDSIETCLK